jgi:hypothetical protein
MSQLQGRKNAILAIETLKSEPETAMVEQSLGLVEELRTRCQEERDRTFDELKAQVEANPQLRTKQVRQGQTVMVVQLTVEEAMDELPQWKQFLAEHEGRYLQEFRRVTNKLKEGLR